MNSKASKRYLDAKVENNGKKMLSPLKNHSNAVKINLNVGGVQYSTTLLTLRINDPDTMLAKMFSGRFDCSPCDDDGCYFIDRDGDIFAEVLSYLRLGDQYEPPKDPLRRSRLLCEAQYFLLEDLIHKLTVTPAHTPLPSPTIEYLGSDEPSRILSTTPQLIPVLFEHLNFESKDTLLLRRIPFPEYDHTLHENLRDPQESILHYFKQLPNVLMIFLYAAESTYCCGYFPSVFNTHEKCVGDSMVFRLSFGGYTLEDEQGNRAEVPLQLLRGKENLFEIYIENEPPKVGGRSWQCRHCNGGGGLGMGHGFDAGFATMIGHKCVFDGHLVAGFTAFEAFAIINH